MLASGVQFIELRKGGGKVPELGEAVLAHVKGYLAERDDPVFIDTFADGAPLFFSLGTRPAGITEGLEQALATAAAGSVRIVQVPAYLGYPEGLSRAAAKPPFRLPIPTKTALRYEVELLRCVEVAGTAAQRVCCPDPLFPCQPPSDAVEMARKTLSDE
eukprot:TRINITY_DN33981_c0_g1_i2.p2 TRINITY_DN33981_c0_g1~~TRINITY_DN33981_c0_g1_i2.p2  ORF type:complete len:159 (-),score=30.50 TRINITY_DN33981_c0_g1_i2:111-587(-)